LDFVFVITALLLVLKMAIGGHLSTPVAALVLIGIVFLASRQNKAIRIALPILTFFWFAIEMTGSPTEARHLIVALFPLIILLFAFYVMFSGLRKKG